MRLEARTVSVPSLDLVKMEERKRPSGADDSAPPAKRQAVAVNGAKLHQDDPPWKDDLEVGPPPCSFASIPLTVRPFRLTKRMP